MRWQYRCCVQGCHFAANGTFPLMWPAGVCLGRAVRRSQFRVLHDDRTVQQRCDTDEHHPSAAASPRPVVAAGVPTSVAGARDASGDDHARRCGRPSPPAPLPRCGKPSPPAPLPRCGRPSPPAPLPRCGRGVFLTPGPAAALRERGDLVRELGIVKDAGAPLLRSTPPFLSLHESGSGLGGR
jgi:hypothetical protein